MSAINSSLLEKAMFPHKEFKKMGIYHNVSEKYTVCILVSQDDITVVGVARACPSDQFSRKIGRKIAVGRAIRRFCEEHNLLFAPPFEEGKMRSQLEYNTGVIPRGKKWTDIEIGDYRKKTIPIPNLNFLVGVRAKDD